MPVQTILPQTRDITRTRREYFFPISSLCEFPFYIYVPERDGETDGVTEGRTDGLKAPFRYMAL